MFRRVGVALTVAFLAVAVISAGAMAASSAPPSEPPGTTSNTTHSTHSVISEKLSTATGNTTVVARLPNRSPEALQASSHESPIAAMRTHAAVSQSPLEDFAASNPHVTIDRRLWLTNAVVLNVDTDHVPLERVVAVDNVQRLHEDYAVTAGSTKPAVPSTEAASPSRRVPAVANASAVSTDANLDFTRALETINVPTAWERFRTRGEGVRVAVLDTGVNPNHPDIDISDSNWQCYEDCSPGEPHDVNGHGTHVSGTIVGGNANDAGLQIGVAPNATLMHAKVVGDSGMGRFSSIVSGMQWAVVNDADVISMSLGSIGYVSEYIDPVRRAQSRGAVVIAAIGNFGSETSSSPANVYDSTAVGSVDVAPDFPSRGTFNVDDGRISRFSGGERIDRSDWSETRDHWPDSYVVPDVVAPGSVIWSADTKRNTPTCGSVETFDLTCKQGTSMATPHVAGTIALMVSASTDDHTPTELRTILETTAVDIGQPTTRQGTGRISATAALAAVADAFPDATFTYGPATPEIGETVYFSAGESKDTDGTITRYEWDFDGNGTVDATGETVSHEFSTVGNYTATLTVTDNDGQTTTDTQTISVSGPTGTVRGVVLNQSEDPIQGATVSLRRATNTNQFEPIRSDKMTSASGQYAFNDVAINETYRIVAEFEGGSGFATVDTLQLGTTDRNIVISPDTASPDERAVADIDVRTGPGSVGVSESFDVTFTVANTGGVDASAGGIQFDTPAGITTSSVYFSSGIDAGEQLTETVGFQTDESVTPDEYAVTATATVGESTDSANISVDLVNESSLARFDRDGTGRIGFTEVLNAIKAHNEGTQIGGEPVTFTDVLNVIKSHNEETQI